VVHLNGYAHAALPWRAPVLVVAHSCVLSWWHACRDSEPSATYCGYYREAVTRGLQAADMVVAPSQAMLDALAEHYGRLKETRVIFNGRDPAQYLPAEKEPFVLSAGRLWDEAKNVLSLEWVAPGLGWPFYVAGDNTDPNGDMVHTGNLRPLGRLTSSELAGWYGRAAIYALPARYEPFGLSALEAGLSGCALVLGDIRSLREIWGDAALFVPPNDFGALHNALESLIQDDNLRRTMGATARSRALRYTPERMATAYLDVYRQLCGQRPARARAPEAPRTDVPTSTARF
jgi:glycosyltransferase involved in cell wall biosynthesis